jgi:hypothetical protein
MTYYFRADIEFKTEMTRQMEEQLNAWLHRNRSSWDGEAFLAALDLSRG